MFRIGGRFVISEIPLFAMNKHYLKPYKKMAREQCLVGSFTGEVGSYNATEPHNGWLVMDGNHDNSVMA